MITFIVAVIVGGLLLCLMGWTRNVAMIAAVFVLAALASL